MAKRDSCLKRAIRTWLVVLRIVSPRLIITERACERTVVAEGDALVKRLEPRRHRRPRFASHVQPLLPHDRDVERQIVAFDHIDSQVLAGKRREEEPEVGARCRFVSFRRGNGLADEEEIGEEDEAGTLNRYLAAVWVGCRYEAESDLAGLSDCSRVA